jgi:hypothetical protein
MHHGHQGMTHAVTLALSFGVRSYIKLLGAIRADTRGYIRLLEAIRAGHVSCVKSLVTGNEGASKIMLVTEHAVVAAAEHGQVW